MKTHHRTAHDRIRLLVAAACLAVLAGILVACGTTTSDEQRQDPPGDGAAVISGTITYGTSTPTAAQDAGQDAVSGTGWVAVGPAAGGSFRLSPQAALAPFVPGEVLVKFAGDAPRVAPGGSAPPATMEAGGLRLDRVRSLGLEAAALYRAASRDRASTIQLVEALNARPDVLWAQPNFLMEPLRTPTDALYPRMWHYRQIGLEDAWDVTTGSRDVVVAVIDTGILPSHFDAPRNLMSGYDFVSNLENGDGDGRDHDPTDLGPFAETNYHGSHVAGTIAAATNNDVDGDGGADGIAGVSWRASVLPIRVLAPVGTLADIVDAIVWAVGDPVPGVPDNLDAARVVNLSLGGRARCSDTPAYQDAINRATAAGASVVVAAGNAGIDASRFVPASCNGVITVGASTIRDERARYSNWGPSVDLMAPGGDVGRDRDGNGEPDGVLSLSRADASGEHVYTYLEGTSMAAPHVSGVIALMLSVAPELQPAEVRDILLQTAAPYSDAQCDTGGSGEPLSRHDCGAGRLDAAAAVRAANEDEPAPPPPPAPDTGVLEFEPERVAFGTDSDAESLRLVNTGSSSVSWELLHAIEDPANPAPLTDALFSAAPLEGTLSPGASRTITIQIDRSELETPGAYRAEFAFDTDGDPGTAEAFLPVTFVIDEEGGAAGLSGPIVVEAILESTGELSGATSSDDLIREYSLTVETGSNFVYAWADETANGVIDPGDWFGAFDNYVLVQEGEEASGVDFAVNLVQSASAVEEALPPGITIEAIEARR